MNSGDWVVGFILMLDANAHTSFIQSMSLSVISVDTGDEKITDHGRYFDLCPGLLQIQSCRYFC